MAQLMEAQFWSVIGDLRYQPTLKRVRAERGGSLIVDTTHAVLIWKPSRVVPTYAVPRTDIVAVVTPSAPVGPRPAHRPVGFGPDGPPVLDPSVPFSVHTAAGDPFDVTVGGATVHGAAFGLTDPDASGLVLLEFDAFDWKEEDEAIMGHPRDPFHRIDVRRSTRPIRIEFDGVVLAESSEYRILYEGVFPLPRFYLPAHDVRVELRRSEHHTVCAYKGIATHYTAPIGERLLADIAWSYDEPLDDASPVQSLVCFYQERLDVIIDGELLPRMRTPWS